MAVKKLFLLMILVCLASLKINAQTTDTLKQALSKEWIINQYEQFGVVEEPAEEQKNDKIILTGDMTCTIIENGTSYSGKWSIDKTRKYIVCTLKDGTVKRNYKIISIKDREAIFEYQSPDLIRTKYYATSK